MHDFLYMPGCLIVNDENNYENYYLIKLVRLYCTYSAHQRFNLILEHEIICEKPESYLAEIKPTCGT